MVESERPTVSWFLLLTFFIVSGAIVVAITIPCFVAPPARRISTENSCINNLRQIDGAKEQWALENRYTAGAIVSAKDVAPFIKGGMPHCPRGGIYRIGTVGENPTCTVASHSLEPVTELLSLVPLGTNTPEIGLRLFHPHTRREIGSAVKIESAHEFPDGEERPGVLLKTINDAKVWVPRKSLDNALFLVEAGK
jgi:hypothetical protein